MIDTTPNYPVPPETLIGNAAKDLPLVLQEMKSETGYGAVDPGHGHRTALASRLVEELSSKGHSKAAAAWAVHRFVQKKMLAAEIATTVDLPVIGTRPDENSVVVRLRDFFGSHADSHRYQIPVFGEPVKKPMAPTDRPVPFECLLVRSTPDLWEWWRSEPQEPLHTSGPTHFVGLIPPAGWEGSYPFDVKLTIDGFDNWLSHVIRCLDELLPKSSLGVAILNDPTDGINLRNAYRLIDSIDSLCGMPSKPRGVITVKEEIDHLRLLRRECRQLMEQPATERNVISLKAFGFPRPHSIRLMVAQFNTVSVDWESRNGLYFHRDVAQIRFAIQELLTVAKQEKVKAIILPELSVPVDCIDLFQTWSKETSGVAVAGSHYHDVDESTIARCPVLIDGALFFTHKLIPAPVERSPVPGQGLSAGKDIIVFKSTPIGNFAVLICSDYLDLQMRHFVLREGLDFLFVPACQLNSDMYHARMSIDCDESPRGLYIAYSNMNWEDASDGRSAFFGVMDSLFHDKLQDAGYTNAPRKHKLCELRNGQCFAIWDVDLDNKRPTVPRTVHSCPNVSVRVIDKPELLVAGNEPPLQRAAQPADGLMELHKRFVEAQDQFPREVSFALVMIPHTEIQAWKVADKWFDDMRGPPQKYGWRCLGFANGGDTSETILVPASERDDGGGWPLQYSLDSWRCWLLRQTTTTPYPRAALNKFYSLTVDACQLLDLRDCGTMCDGQLLQRSRGEYQHLLRWAVEQLDSEECRKLTWFDPPNEHVRTPLQQGSSPRRWVVEMPCVFATVAHALERQIRGLGKPWPSV